MMWCGKYVNLFWLGQIQVFSFLAFGFVYVFGSSNMFDLMKWEGDDAVGMWLPKSVGFEK